MLGVVYFEAGQYTNVLPYFEKAYNLDLINKEILFNLAYFLDFIGEKEESIKFKESLKKVDTKSYLDLVEATASFA
ncbi:hypothetical protein D3C77_631760 [compost metagenome]